MTCDEFMDGTEKRAKPSPGEQRALDEHAASCKECAAFARDRVSVEGMGAMLRGEPPSKEFNARLDFGADVAVEVRSSERAIARSRLRRALALASVCALALAGAAFGLGARWNAHGTSPTPRISPDEVTAILPEPGTSPNINEARILLEHYQQLEASAPDESARIDALLGEATNGLLIRQLTRKKAQEVLDHPRATVDQKAAARHVLAPE